MILRLAFAILFLSAPASGEVLFLDLNDSVEEINACQAGLDENYARQMAEYNADPDNYLFTYGRRPAREKVRVVRAGEGGQTVKNLKSALKELRRQKVKIDSFVLSGEDGSGHFFGTLGDVNFEDLKQVWEDPRYPELKNGVKTSALWGCYPSTVYSQEQYWLNNLPGMQATMGFPLQGPNNTAPENHNLMQQYCRRRGELAAATSADALCEFYKSLERVDAEDLFERTSLAVCNREIVASDDYASPGEAEMCFSYEELHRRCDQFAKEEKWLDIYRCHLSGKCEITRESEQEGRTPLRRAYNKLQVWRHCAEQFARHRGYDLPDPASVIRLIKYNEIKDSLVTMHAGTFSEYDQKLKQLGLGPDLQLGDIRTLSRQELNTKIEKAVVALKEMSEGKAAPQAVESSPADISDLDALESVGVEVPKIKAPGTAKGGTDPQVVLRQAQCLRQTLVNMNPHCTAFRIIKFPDTPSSCVLSYEQAKKRGPDEEC